MLHDFHRVFSVAVVFWNNRMKQVFEPEITKQINIHKIISLEAEAMVVILVGSLWSRLNDLNY